MFIIKNEKKTILQLKKIPYLNSGVSDFLLLSILSVMFVMIFFLYFKLFTNYFTVVVVIKLIIG